ncbi:MAG: transcription factor S [Ignisphaera sp.]
MFCPKCGTLLIFDKTKKVYRCPKCGYETRNLSNKVIMTKSISHNEKERLTVVDSSTVSAPPTATLVKGHVRCPKCGSEEVYAWQMQTRAADEPPTTFYKCAKCGHTWREY